MWTVLNHQLLSLYSECRLLTFTGAPLLECREAGSRPRAGQWWGGTGGRIGVAAPGSQAEASPPAQPQPPEAPSWDDGVTRGSVFPSQGHGIKGSAEEERAKGAVE